MCHIFVTTTRYTGCPASCTKEEEKVYNQDCLKFQETGEICKDAKPTHMGHSKSKSQCDNHKDEGYSDRRTR